MRLIFSMVYAMLVRLFGLAWLLAVSVGAVLIVVLVASLKLFSSKKWIWLSL